MMVESSTSPPPTARRFSPTPVETSVKKVRRFAVEPVETTTRSSRREDAPQQQQQQQQQKPEDAAAAAVVATDEQHKKKKSSSDVPTKRRFKPEPVETTFKSSKQDANNPLPTPEPTPVHIPEHPIVEETPKPRRKFVPELIETCKRSKRAGDARPATLPTDKTDLTPGVPNIYTRRRSRPSPSPTPPTPFNSALNVHNTQIHPPQPRRQGSMKPHLNTRRSTRQNSFQPELDVILSDPNSSDEERTSRDISTPAWSDSYDQVSDDSIRLQMARTRESCDERFSGYLLELAAKAAQKQLEEQALAAFPNESFREAVEHFYNHDIDGHSDGGSVEGIGQLMQLEEDDPIVLEIRRKSTIEPGWAAKEMQAHQEKLNRLREEETNAKIAAEATKPSFHDPFWTNGMTSKLVQQATEEVEPTDPIKEKELAKMRSAASPPMLGGDLKFRMCPSPKATKFESDQKPDVQLKKSDTGGGLWGGYCVTDEAEQYLSPTLDRPHLLQTPHVEREDPFSSAFGSVGTGTRSPKTLRSSGVGMIAGLDERLQAEVARTKAEEALLAEFDDSFITQVYNYLSLGYPSLARQYDDELAKIARIPTDDLSADDSSKQAQGYIGISPGSPGRNGEPQPVCARWKALKIYIHEWAKQHPSLSGDGRDPNAWGVRARRGSWAI